MDILFDLDGTLTDPFEGITRCIVHALTALGRPCPSRESLSWCIGPPLAESFARLLGSGDARLVGEAVALYRERFSVVGLFENEVYGGIVEALETLEKAGHTLYVATSKPRVFAERIVRHFGLDPYFAGIYGSELNGRHTDKASLIAHILEKESIPASRVVMVGDRKHDMIGATANGVRGIGVLWGFGAREELETSGAEVCVATPRELVIALMVAKDAI